MQWVWVDLHTTGTPGDWPESFDLQLKADISGLGGSSLVDPAAFLRFLLEDSTFGLGLASSFLATGLFNSVAAQLSAELAFTIDRPLEARSIIQRICRLFRVIFYKLRNGQLALHYPVPFNKSQALDLNSSYWQEEMLIELVEDNSFTQIINSFEIAYFEDFLDQPADEAFLRRARGGRFQELLYLDAEDSSDSDTVRQSKMAMSQKLFGKKPYNDDFELIQKETDAFGTPRLTCLVISNYLTDICL